MAICPNCGADSNFEWAASCKCCHQPLSRKIVSTDNDIEITNETSQLSTGEPVSDVPMGQDERIEVGPTIPMDYIVGNENQPDTTEFEPQTVKPLPIESELTLYHDSDVKLTLLESARSTKLMLETAQEKVENFEVPNESRPQPAEIPVHIAASTEEASPEATQKIGEKPEVTINKKSAIKEIKDEPKYPEPFLPYLKQSPKVIYLSGKSLKVTGGLKISSGDQVIINEQNFTVKPMPNRGLLFYLGLGAIGIVLFAAIMFILAARASGDKGQLVGIMTDPTSGKPLAGVPVTVAELNRKAVTNQAGFFAFQGVPSGLYTINSRGGNNTQIQERVTIMKNEITTVALKEGPTEAPNRLALSETKPQNEPENSAVALSGHGLLKLTLSPENASAYIDDKPIGVGSHAYKLASGSYSLTIRKTGYNDKTQRIRIESDKALTLKVSLNPEEALNTAGKSESQLGFEQESLGNYAGAVEHYNKALRKGPDPEAALGKGRCFKAQGLADEALFSLTAAAKMASDKGDINSQIMAYSGIIDIKPNTFMAYALRGDIFYTEGQFSKAASDFSKVVELDNRNLGAYYKLGNSYYQNKEYQAALKTFLAAQELNFADPKAEAYIAKTYLAMGDKKNSKKAYDRFKELATYPTRLEFKRDPDWQNVLNALGVEY